MTSNEDKMKTNPATEFPGAESANVLRAALQQWVVEGKKSVSAAQRLSDLNAIESIAAKGMGVSPASLANNELNKSNPPQSSTGWAVSSHQQNNALKNPIHPPVSIWPSFALAALVFMMFGVAIFYAIDNDPQPTTNANATVGRTFLSASGQNPIPTPSPHSTNPNELYENSDKPTFTAAEVLPDAMGLYRCADSNSDSWSALSPGTKCESGELIQAAFDKGAGEIKAFQHHRVKLSSGSMLRLGNNPKRAEIDLWRGKMEVWAEKEPVYLGTLAANRSRKDLLTLKPGQHASVQSVDFSRETFEQDGVALMRQVGMNPISCTYQKHEGFAVLLQDASSNLLKVIVCNFHEKSVSDIVQKLQNDIGVLMSLSLTAEARVGETIISLELGSVTGAEAISKLAERVGMYPQIRDGEIVFEVPVEPKPAPARDESF